MDKIDINHQLQINSDIPDSMIQTKNDEVNQNQILEPIESIIIPSDDQNKINNNLTIKLSQVELNQKCAHEIFNEQILPILEFIYQSNKDLDQCKIQHNMKLFDFKHSSLQTFGRMSQYADANISNQQLKEAYHKSEENFPYQILIRGDGNCFYRSFMINIMFMIIIQQNTTEALKIFKKVFKLNRLQYKLDKFNESQVDLTPEFKLYFLHFWISKFVECHSVLGQQQKYDLKNIFEDYNQLPFVDVATVVICRNIILNKFNFLLKDPSYCFFITEESQVNSPKYLLQYGQEAEDIIIPIAAKAFEVDLKVKNIYRDQQQIFTDLFEYKNDENKVSNIVSVLFTKGHYNCLFEKQLYDESTEKFNWPIQELIQIEQQQQQDDILEIEESFQNQEEVKEILNSKQPKTDNQFGVDGNHNKENNYQQDYLKKEKEDAHEHQKAQKTTQSQQIQKTQDDKEQKHFNNKISILSISFGLGLGSFMFFLLNKLTKISLKLIKSKLLFLYQKFQT
ncbi:hypothetical protein ABPG72_013095 [Tetrahymena utriculariae]